MTTADPLAAAANTLNAASTTLQSTVQAGADSVGSTANNLASQVNQGIANTLNPYSQTDVATPPASSSGFGRYTLSAAAPATGVDNGSANRSASYTGPTTTASNTAQPASVNLPETGSYRPGGTGTYSPSAAATIATRPAGSEPASPPSTPIYPSSSPFSAPSYR
jgi:hypothetical protein